LRKTYGGVNNMDNQQYREAIERTMKPMTEKDKIAMLALGIAGEAGEIADTLKKVVFHGHELDIDELIKELGDLEWYLQHLKKHYDISDEIVYIKNIMKLQKRYPHGFREEDSINRVV
jgi:NTP pyrophosphatase (non-canonical NTP hydrolase)